MSKFSEGGGAVYHERVVLTLGTLASLDALAVTGLQDGSRSQGFRYLKSEYIIGVAGMTTDDGPVVVGVGGPGLSTAEIEEAIEADPQSSHDAPAGEQAMRPVWKIGAAVGDGMLNNGLPIIVNQRWSYPEDATMAFFAYNSSGAALTTGTVITMMIKHYGVWLRD